MLTGRLTKIGLLTICGLLLASGPATAADTKVMGTVIVAGKPLGGGTIVLHLRNGEFLGTKVSKEGTYAFQKLAVSPAKYMVTIEGKGVRERYGDEKVSALRIEVREGENTFDFDLE